MRQASFERVCRRPIFLDEMVSLDLPVVAASWTIILSAFTGRRSKVCWPMNFRHTYVWVKIVTVSQALRSEKERLERERDKKIDGAIRRIQRERLEFEETSKAEADEEARRLDEVSSTTYVCVLRSCEGSRMSIDRVFFLFSYTSAKPMTVPTTRVFQRGRQRHGFNTRHVFSAPSCSVGFLTSAGEDGVRYVDL